MPADTKITPALIRRMAALHEKGESARKIGETLGVSHTTVARWLRERQLAPNGTPGAPRKSGAQGKEKSKSDDASARTGQELALRVTKAEAELGVPGASLALMRRRLVEITAMIDAQQEALTKGETSAALYERLCKLQREYAREVASLEPPAEANPETDPTNLEAAGRVVSKLEQLVADAEAQAKCRHCGRNPHR